MVENRDGRRKLGEIYVQQWTAKDEAMIKKLNSNNAKYYIVRMKIYSLNYLNLDYPSKI